MGFEVGTNSWGGNSAPCEVLVTSIRLMDERRRRRPKHRVLAHEKLDVYQAAIELLTEAALISGRLTKEAGDLRSQFRRCVPSIPLNIAEGVGRSSVADSRRFFAISRGSAMEAGACLDVLYVLGLIPDQQYETCKKLVSRIVAMLSRMILD